MSVPPAAAPPPDDRLGRNPSAQPLVAGDDLLPPIEPPSAGFIVQLFIVPALIVLVVVAVWTTFSWLVHRTTMRPEDLIDGLQGSSVARWQRASELADMLRNERFAEFRTSSAAATKLAGILDREIDDAGTAGGQDEQSATLRYFLCRALGEFTVQEGTDVLLKAATTERDPNELIVRRGAIQALAVRAYDLTQLDPAQSLSDPQVETALVRLSSDENNLIRSEAAFALGQIGGPVCLARLEEMVDDPYVDARYNAAVALAQHGNPKALETLAEMLDPDEFTSVEQEKNEAAQFSKRTMIISSALNAVDDLAKKNPGADFSSVVAVLERIVQADRASLDRARIRPQVVARAQKSLDFLRPSK